MGRSARPRARRACSGDAASQGLLAVEVRRERRWVATAAGARASGAGPTRPGCGAPRRGRREVEVEAQVRVVGEHGHAVARGERGEELLGLADGAEETAQAAALEVLLEEEDDEAARGEPSSPGRRGRESTRATLGDSATHTADSTGGAAAVDLQPEVRGRRGRAAAVPPESVTRASRTTREVSTPGRRWGGSCAAPAAASSREGRGPIASRSATGIDADASTRAPRRPAVLA